MLLKYSSYQKRNKLTGGGKAQRSTGKVRAFHGKGKGNRKGQKAGLPNKRIKAIANRREEVAVLPVDASDNSNDSGLGFDHHLEFQIPKNTNTSYLEPEYCWPDTENTKKQRLDIKLESDNANDDFTFPQTQTRLALPASAVTDCARGKIVSTGKNLKRNNQASATQSVGVSRDGKVQLVIISQPETQHRARYQTEGSRGAVKDRTGNGFPMVKLNGYNKPATLEVYIGTDQGRVAPHMFYQACRVSGKNSTPCVEKKVEGTVLIEIELDPMKEMLATCDCVGILKERNVDVEHRFPEESSGRSKKKSTRCRMVFKTVITNSDNTQETLQVTSQPIICTQPPGIPEISKKSLSSCPVTGGLELFILGKNFLKDTKVVFTEGDVGSDNYWQSVVQPDKEFLQQSHLVCVIPPYKLTEIKEPVAVKLIVLSSGRNSEPHTFIYSPVGSPPLQALVQEPSVTARAISQNLSPSPSYNGQNLLVGVPLLPMGSNSLPTPTSQFIPEENCKLPVKEELSTMHPVMLMPPPTHLPLSVRRASQPPPPPMLITDGGVEMKREVDSPVAATSASDLSTSQTPSLATIQRFVSSTKLPSLSVENYLSKIENKPLVASDVTPSLLSATPSLVSSEERIIQDQLAATIAKEAEAATKLDEFVNSTVEAHLSPNRDLKPKAELLIDDVNVPMQASPMNCSFVSSSHINDQQLLSPPQNAMCNLMVDQTVQSVTTTVLNDTPSSIILNNSFSPGKDIHSVTISSQYQDMSITTSSTANPVSSSADIIMKSVVNDLNQASTRYSTSPEVLIQPTITSPVVSVTSPIRHPMMMTSQFPNPDCSEPMNIGSANFVSEPMSIDQKCDSSNPTPFQSTMFVPPDSDANSTIVPHFTQQQDISAGRMPPTVKAPALDALYSQTIIYSSPEMPSTNEKITRSQSAFEVIPSSTISSSTYSEPDRPDSSVTSDPQFTLSTSASVPHSPDKADPSTSPLSSSESNVVVDTVCDGGGRVVGRRGVEEKPVTTTTASSQQPVKKCEEGIPLHELAQMSEQDLLIYINPSCFDQV